jgi:hypothetical protein
MIDPEKANYIPDLVDVSLYERFQSSRLPTHEEITNTFFRTDSEGIPLSFNPEWARFCNGEETG